jgi:hypothetical protein
VALNEHFAERGEDHPMDFVDELPDAVRADPSGEAPGD